MLRRLLLTLLVAGATGCGSGYAVRHRVAAGENLATVAGQYGVTAAELRAFNRLTAQDEVRPGDILFVPGGAPPTRAPARPAAADPKPVAVARTRPAPASPPARPAVPVPPRPSQPEGHGVADPPRLVWPVAGTLLRGFGVGPAGESRGVDIAVAPGTEVRAAGSGTVTYAGVPARTYGALVIVRHTDELYTVYSNLERSDVVSGNELAVEQVIGISGAATGTLPPHVHFEVRRREQALDPLLFLPAR